MNQSKYYVPMSEKAFEEIKAGAIKIWRTYDDTHGYATEKIGKIENLENVGDNGMYIIAMFDYFNISKLLSLLSEATLAEVKDERLPEEYWE